MHILKPTDLIFERDIIRYNPKYHEKYVWLIHLIIIKNITSKNTFAGYINLKSEILRKYIGDKFSKKIIAQLRKSGILNVNNHYEAGKNSKSYRLTEKYSSCGITRVSFESKKAKKYLLKYEAEMQRKLSASNNTELFQELLDNIRQVDIDFVGATENSDQLFENGDFESLHAKSCHDYYIESISEGNIFFTTSRLTGRIYHSICNCNKAIRKFLSFQGEELFQVDIANSQPVLFCPMVQDFVRRNWGKYCIRMDRERLVKGIIIISTRDIPYVESFYPADVLTYINLTKEGKFYDFLMDKFDTPESEKADFKVLFFKEIFYSKIKAQEKYKKALLFKALFPTVYDAIIWYKRNDHADLSNQLQKAESDIMINGVCKRLKFEYKEEDRPFYIPVHDALVCIKKDMDIVYKLIEEEMLKALGFTPHLRRKPFYEEK